MIEEPPLLTVKDRPAAAPGEALLKLAARLGAHPTSVLCDAMSGRGALSPEIKPLAPGTLPDGLAAPVLTVDCGPDDILALAGALTEVRPGEALVVATHGWRGSAAFGDRVAGMARNNGCVGLVTDGLVRDRAGLIGVGLPIFCAGLSPNSPFSKGPGRIGLPVLLGGLSVETGDIVVGDRDGAVIVPGARAEEIADKADAVAQLEIALDAEVAEGRKAADPILELMRSDRVRRV